MSLTQASGIHCFYTLRIWGRTVFLFLCLCAALGFFYHVSKVESTGNGPYVLDNTGLPNQVGNPVTLSLASGQQARSGRIVPVPAPVRLGSWTNDKTTGSNLKLTVAPSTATTSSSTTKMRYPWNEDEEALVDAKRKSMDDLASEAAAGIGNIPSTPYILGRDKNGPTYFHNSSCARFPTIYHLEFSNIHWQTQRTSKATFYLYGAYYDIRSRNPLGPSLRILGMIDRYRPKVTTYCQIWFQGEKMPTFSKVLEYQYIWYRSNSYNRAAYQPYLLTCRLTDHNGKVPASVSIVEKPCDPATNNLRVLFNKPTKKKAFAVCVKGLDFVHVDNSVRLVEWIELLGLLGADKIFIYNYAAHPNATKVLRYYQETGKVDLIPLTLPGSQPNDPRLLHIFMHQNNAQKWLNEQIPYNDCLYRSLYQYEYIGVFDIDEVIMPMKAAGWTELMREVDGKSRLTNRNISVSSFTFRHVFFMDVMMQENQWFQGIPKYLHMLQHVYRSPSHLKPGAAVKSFHDPERVLLVHNHIRRACLDESCRTHSVETDLAQLNHYREICILDVNKCNKKYRERRRMDTTIWRYKDELIDRATKTLKYLGFIPSFHSAATSGLASPKN